MLLSEYQQKRLCRFTYVFHSPSVRFSIPSKIKKEAPLSLTNLKNYKY